MPVDRKGKCCSCSRPALPGKARCQVHADESKARYAAKKAAGTTRYAKLLALGVCPQCGKEPIIPGMTVGPNCREYQRAKTASRREAYAPRQKELAKKWYEDRKAEGICPECNERPARPGRTTCGPCGHRMAVASRRNFAIARKIALAHYGLACRRCGESTYQFLQLHHTAGDGAEHRQRIGQSRLFRWTIENGFPAGIETLCANCNFEDGLKIRKRLGPVNELPVGDIPCFFCKDEMARVDRISCHACALRRKAWDQALYLKRRNLVLDYYGRQCACCGTTMALQMDHIAGGGRKHLREIGSSALYRWLIKHGYPTGFQTLCANCNFAKNRDGVCPHQPGAVAAHLDSG
jgi:hypothetical protein